MKVKRHRRTKLQIQQEKEEREQKNNGYCGFDVKAHCQKPLKVDADIIHHWAKFAEKPVYKLLSSFLEKLDKSKKKYKINWLYSLDFEVTYDNVTKVFQYKYMDE